MHAQAIAGGASARSLVIALIAFLTLVDLFAAQAILPALTKAYGVTPAAMGFAVNASTMGMAIGGLAVAFAGRRIDRRKGVLISLLALALPTTLLASAPDLTTFTGLRIAQGLCMSTAFALTLAYLGERCSAADAAAASAAYITGNVASNLFGRLMAAAVADHLGLAATFYTLAGLNIAGATLAFLWLARTPKMDSIATGGAADSLRAVFSHVRNPALRAGFGIGFAILFAFIGTFTYVNFVLVGEPLLLSPMQLGFVYLVFLPAIFTTPLAGRVAARFGTVDTFRGSLFLAGTGLPLMLLPSIASVMAGLALVGVGTFFAQAAATGFVSRTAASASGIYLASYFLGGLVGSAVLGLIFDRFGWTACVAGIAISLAAAARLAGHLRQSPAVGAAQHLAVSR
jgi:MFS transporter, YNFM family, putative membrane transport protein